MQPDPGGVSVNSVDGAQVPGGEVTVSIGSADHSDKDGPGDGDSEEVRGVEEDSAVGSPGESSTNDARPCPPELAIDRSDKGLW